MKIKLLIVCMLVSLGVNAAHNWERVNYRNSTIFSASVWIDGHAAEAGDVVGAFVDNECRMMATVFVNNDTAYISSVIHGEKVENIKFKVWQKTSDKIFQSQDLLMSKPGDCIFLHHIDVK